MTEGTGGLDKGVEHELRRLLREREPGPAPLGLRERVDRIPDVEARPGRGRLVARVGPLLALAAVLVVAVLTGQALRLSPTLPPGASPVPSPVATFDPSLEGPGVGPATDPALYWALVLVACAALMLLALVLRGRRRLIPAVVAAALFGWALLGSFMPVPVSVYFSGPGSRTIAATMPTGTDLTQYYVVASPRQPFTFGLGVIADSPLPVRFEGLVGMPGDLISNAGPRWTAVWLDADPNGGATGPAMPFVPFDIAGQVRSLWVVGRAGICASGPAFDQNATGTGGSTSPGLILRLSVLGWPRTVDLSQPAIVEPDTASCLPMSSSPSTAPLPSPSG